MLFYLNILVDGIIKIKNTTAKFPKIRREEVSNSPILENA